MILRNLSILLTTLVLSLTGCEPTPTYVYDDWDMDDDDLIAEEEFYTTWNDAGYYEAWDTDGDGYIDAMEWEAGVDEYYSDWDYDAYGDFANWDLDDDELLGEDEFGEGYYTAWDMDGDGYIDATEYEQWYYDI